MTSALGVRGVEWIQSCMSLQIADPSIEEVQNSHIFVDIIYGWFPEEGEKCSLVKMTDSLCPVISDLWPLSLFRFACACVKKENASPISPLPVRFYCTSTDFPKRAWYIFSHIIERCTVTMSLIFLE